MPPIEITCPPSFEPDEWEAHKRDARYIIWQRGRGELDVHHGYLAGQLGLFNYAKNYFSVLDAVSVEEDAAGGPMVTALVTAIGSEVPGGRFFELAEKLGHEVEDRAEFALAMRQWSIDWIRAHPERAQINTADGQTG